MGKPGLRGPVNPSAQRGEIWLVDLNPTRGREQAGCRPALILSVDRFNAGHSGLVFAVPLTKTMRSIPTHVVIHPPEGGVKVESAILCEALRSVSRERLIDRWGLVSSDTLLQVEDRVRMLLGI